MDQNPITQLQCPKCGQYRMGKVTHFGPIPILLSILTFGVYAIIHAVWTVRVGDTRLKTGDKLKCANCKAVFVFKEED